ncbi:MAG TPA: hypothetical protein VKA47_00770 [Solirubrobacterales bacterium]|nr:hypothetical protein [Solirubrobacterales bacterium]
MSGCRRCGARIPPRPPGRTGAAPIYCSDRCRKRASEERDPDDSLDDAAILAVRERLERASYADERCRCEWPLAALDEDDVWRCVKCARRLVPSIRHELPPAA